MKRRTFLKSLCALVIAPMLAKVKGVRAAIPVRKLPDIFALEKTVNVAPWQAMSEKIGCIGEINGQTFILQSVAGIKDGDGWRVLYQFHGELKPAKNSRGEQVAPIDRIYRHVDFRDELRDSRIVPRFAHITCS